MKVEIKGFIFGKKEEWQTEPSFSFFACDMSQYGYVMIKPYTLLVDVPDDFSFVSGMVSALEQQKKLIREEFNERIKDINERISKVLAISYVENEKS